MRDRKEAKMLLWPTLGQLTTFFQKSEIDENLKKLKNS